MELTLATANVNAAPHEMVTWGFEDYGQFIEATGYDGMEYHPARSRLAKEVWFGNADTSVVTSLHQGFRSELVSDIPDTSLREFLKKAAVVVGLPTAANSLQQLEDLQAQKREKLPVVLYPNDLSVTAPHNRTPSFIDLRGTFGRQLFQPSPEVCSEWGLLQRPDIEELTNAMEARGFDGVCIDTFHWMRRADNGTVLPNWQETLPHLLNAELVDQMHIGFGRIDLGGTIDELKLFMKGQGASTETGEMIAMVNAANLALERPTYAVVELPAMSVYYKDRVSFHAELTEAIREI